MGINFFLAKKYAAEQLLKLALNYIEKDPEGNFIQFLNLLDRVARRENHHQQIKLVKEEYQKNPLIVQYLRKLSEIAPSYRKGLLVNFLVNAGLLGVPYQDKMAGELGVKIPWAILIDPTSACNLNCYGCWAGKYNKTDTLSFSLLDRIITQAKELGIYFIVLSGGEPTLYPNLIELCDKHSDVGFLMFTNGTLIDDKMADKMLEVGNLTPAISLEGMKEHTDKRRGQGVFDRIMETMSIFQKKGIIFGSSLTITRKNAQGLFADDQFIDCLLEKGASYCWLFHYIPIGNDPDLEMMVTPEQRAMLARQIPELRSRKPIFLLDFWNDGTYSGGCIAGGRRYFHINACGEVEPCAFVHFAVENIKEKSLRTVLQNPLFKAYQKSQPFNDNLLLPCPIIDNPDCLRDIIKETGAYPTHSGADEILKSEINQSLNKLAGEWEKLARPIFKERIKQRKS